VHAGPFGNIAHGNSSSVGDLIGIRGGDYLITEAGFGADMGAERFFNIKCRASGMVPDAAVLVATVRALKAHSGKFKIVPGKPLPADLLAENPDDVRAGAANLIKPSNFQFCYEASDSLKTKIEKVATKIYGAANVTYSAAANTQLERYEKNGFGNLPVCIAKTHLSISADASLKGAPTGHTVNVREVRASVGAGFVYPICGDMTTMPGLSATPAATIIDFDDHNEIIGLS